MNQIQKSRVVPFSCEQMYHLVDDIEHYGDFLPYFSGSEIHHRNEDEVQATLNILAGGISKSFTTCNRLQKNKMIELRLIDGPFNHLEGFWRFDSAPHGCLISFDLEFEFSSRMFSMLLGPVFEQISSKMIDAFCERAHIIYQSDQIIC